MTVIPVNKFWRIVPDQWASDGWQVEFRWGLTRPWRRVVRMYLWPPQDGTGDLIGFRAQFDDPLKALLAIKRYHQHNDLTFYR